MDQTDERADHVADSVAFGDDEAVEGAYGAKGGVEVARLRDGVCPHKGLADHEDLVWLGKLREFLEGGHEALVVVATTGGVDEDDVVALLGGVGDCVLGDGGGVLAVALLVEFDLASFAGGEFFEVADVDGELLDGAGAEGVAGGDEDFVLVLQEEEADLGEVGGLADAVDADDGHDVGAALAEGRDRWGGDGVDFAEEVEG